jgi:hypothetical protein
MIDGYRRGHQAGADEARTRNHILPQEELQSLAQKSLARLRAGGYAHLEPEEKFVQGFCIGYAECLLLNN